MYGFFKFLAAVLVVCLLPFAFWFVFYRFKGFRLPRRSISVGRSPSVLRRVFFDFPRRYVLDVFQRNPDAFAEYGVHIIAGEQGAGKTITLTYMLREWQRKYPKVQVRTNYGYAFENGEINHWKDIVSHNNGELGEIDVIDEIQNWFNSLQSKDFPVEMLTEVTQQRKQRKIVIGTSQVFNRVAKPIREQTTFLYEPVTLFGCLTIVRVYKPVVGDDGLAERKLLRRMFFFVHSDELRSSFDTYRKIQNLADSGFKPASDQMRGSGQVIQVQQSPSSGLPLFSKRSR